MALKFKNNSTGELNAGISEIATSLELKTGQGDRFPVAGTGDFFFGTLEDVSGNKEIVKVTARTLGSQICTIERAQEGTVARAFLADSKFELRLTAAVVQTIRDELTTVQGNITTLSADKANASDVTAHVGATGANVHGLGTMSTQNANGVAITGGSAQLDNEALGRSIKARDHNGGATPEVTNVIVGTSTPPTANTVPIGTIFLKYTP
jgi:hypothetical protein